MIARFNAKGGSALLLGLLLLLPGTSFAASSGCSDIFVALGQDPSNAAGAHDVLTAALKQATLPLGSGTANGGFGLNMWAAIVDRDGIVCMVTFTGGDRGEQWPGSRVISAQKANTANAFSLPGLALSTANLYTAVQPGGTLFGLQESNPVDVSVAYRGDPNRNGTRDDAMVDGRIGGVNVFGGGLALYRASDGKILGGIGVSGDSSCADHNIAWKTRAFLNLDRIPGGVDPASGTDNIVYDIAKPGKSQAVAATSASGWGHPQCSDAATAVANGLPTAFPIGSSPQP
jgi:uncharacterized protein GlcG (DUF336 family)